MVSSFWEGTSLTRTEQYHSTRQLTGELLRSMRRVKKGRRRILESYTVTVLCFSETMKGGKENAVLEVYPFQSR
jgi:hypothetical protein